MKAEELRLGNIVFNSEAKEITEIYLYGIHRILECDRDGQKHPWEPVELTEEILLNFGFKRFQKDFSKPGLIIHSRKRGFVVRKSIPQIKHVHQLQNLYFALTGIELKYKFSNP